MKIIQSEQLVKYIYYDDYEKNTFSLIKNWRKEWYLMLLNFKIK